MKPGKPADLILVDIERPWLVNEEEIVSKSRNTPFENERFTGMVTHTMVRR